MTWIAGKSHPYASTHDRFENQTDPVRFIDTARVLVPDPDLINFVR